MSYDATPPYNGIPPHLPNSHYYHDESFNPGNHDNFHNNGPQTDPIDAEMLAEAQQHSQHDLPTQESDHSEQAALDESLSWITNANRQQHAGVSAPLAVSEQTLYTTSRPHI